MSIYLNRQCAGNTNSLPLCASEQNLPKYGAGSNKLIARMVLLVGILAAQAAGFPVSGREPQRGLTEASRQLYKGNHEHAATLARNYVKLHPENPEGLILLARAEIAEGKYLPAYQELRKALRAAPENIDALYFLGQLCQLLSQTEYQQLLAVAHDSARAHQFLAASYHSEGNTVKALEEYQAALKTNPRSVEVLDELGDLELGRFRVNEAVSYFSRAIEINPRDVRALSGLGAAYVAGQEIERGIEYFHSAIYLEPRSGGLHLGLGNALLRGGKADEAVTEFNAALTLKPGLRQAYTQLARAYQMLGKLHEAQDALRRSNRLSEQEMRSVEGSLSEDQLISVPPDQPPNPNSPPPEQ